MRPTLPNPGTIAVPPADPEPRPALVVFVDRTECRCLRLLREGFRHCFVVLREQGFWIACDPLKDRIELSVLPVPDSFDLAGFYVERGHTVLCGPRRPDLPRRSFSIAPLTCVSVAKRLLGVRAPWVFTPWQLYERLSEQGFCMQSRRTTRNLPSQRSTTVTA